MQTETKQPLVISLGGLIVDICRAIKNQIGEEQYRVHSEAIERVVKDHAFEIMETLEGIETP